jgi:TRAP transporter TAXI family solute receptor
MRLIGVKGGHIDLAYMQEDALPAPNVRLIASLYDEVLHIVTTTASAQNIRTVFDLEGARVSLGGAGSGTRELAQRVLKHFDVTVGQDLALDPLPTAAALTSGDIDAAFLLSAIPSDLVYDLARNDTIRFISLGEVPSWGDEAHALERVFPGVRQDVIPRSTYVRLPREPVHTVGVAAMLVARADRDEETVQAVTAAIFEHRGDSAGLQGSALNVAQTIRENYDPSSVNLPYHPGATAYYRREEPPFLVEYAETLSFVITVILGVYSLSIALRQWLRRRLKNRIDAYLLEVERLAGGVATLDLQQLTDRRSALLELRRTVFDDLVAERLAADHGFVILQNHLRDELAAIDAHIEGLEQEGR